MIMALLLGKQLLPLWLGIAIYSVRMITQDQLKDVLDRADKLKHYLKIDERQIEFEE